MLRNLDFSHILSNCFLSYCMRIMLDKIPEGDWLCEECRMKEELEMKRLDKTETFSGKSNVQCLNKEGENIGKSINPENLANLNTKPTDPEACGSSKEMQNPMGTGKRHTYQMDLASPMVKKVSETADETLKAASPRICSAFAHENSSKNFHTAEVKRTNMASSLGSQYAKSSWTSSHSPSLGYSSSIVKEKLFPSKGKISCFILFRLSQMSLAYFWKTNIYMCWLFL